MEIQYVTSSNCLIGPEQLVHKVVGNGIVTKTTFQERIELRDNLLFSWEITSQNVSNLMVVNQNEPKDIELERKWKALKPPAATYEWPWKWGEEQRLFRNEIAARVMQSIVQNDLKVGMVKRRGQWKGFPWICRSKFVNDFGSDVFDRKRCLKCPWLKHLFWHFCNGAKAGILYVRKEDHRVTQQWKE